MKKLSWVVEKVVGCLTCLWRAPYPWHYHRYLGGISNLDGCLVPEGWVSSARWNPQVFAIEPRGLQGHFTLKLQVSLKPALRCIALFVFCIAKGTVSFSICLAGMGSRQSLIQKPMKKMLPRITALHLSSFVAHRCIMLFPHFLSMKLVFKVLKQIGAAREVCLLRCTSPCMGNGRGCETVQLPDVWRCYRWRKSGWINLWTKGWPHQ